MARADRRYCSDACKQRNYRWRNRQNRYRSQVEHHIAKLAEYLDYPETHDGAAEKLAQLIGYIQTEARKHNLIIKGVK